MAEQQGLRRALARFTQTALAKAWATWRWYAEARRQQQHKLQAAVDRWLRSTLSAALAQVGWAVTA